MRVRRLRPWPLAFTRLLLVQATLLLEIESVGGVFGSETGVSQLFSSSLSEELPPVTSFRLALSGNFKLNVLPLVSCIGGASKNSFSSSSDVVELMVSKIIENIRISISMGETSANERRW